MRSTLVSAGICASMTVVGAAGVTAPATATTSATASAQQRWELDPGFGAGGIVSTAFPGSGHRYTWGLDSVVQPDNRTVVAGVAVSERTDDAAVARYLPDGSLDPSFGTGGRVTIGPHALFQPAAVALQDVGGKTKVLLAVATTYVKPYRYRCSVIRLNPDGSLDTNHDADPAIAFGHDGTKVVEFAHNSGFCGGMAVAPDGKIVVSVEADGNAGDVGVFRLLGGNGALDPGFGTGGLVTIAAPGYQAPGPVAVQPSSGGAPRVVVGGLVARQHGYDWALWRLRSDGRLDPTFGTDGRVVTTMYDARVKQSFESVRALSVAPDGTIVAGGDYRSWPAGKPEPQDTAAVAKYLPDGKLDPAFATGGTVHIPYDGQGNSSAEDLTLDAQGRILIGGYLSAPTSGKFLVGGFTGGGIPDTRFGTPGYLEFVVGGGPYTGGESVALDPAGRLVVAGIYGDPDGFGTGDRFGVARLRLAPSVR